MKKIIMLLTTGLFLIFNGSTEAQTMTNADLSTKQQSIVKIAAFTASGNLEKLSSALNEGLEAGLSINEINEVLIQMYAYTGFPRSLNGITTFMSVVDEREASGRQDAQGSVPILLDYGTDKSLYGENVRKELNGGRATVAGWQTFAPGIELFLKEHLFADIFARGVLDYQTRELATVAALAALSGVNPQLQSHMGMAMNQGLTEAQLNALVAVISSNVGQNEGKNADEVLKRLLESRR